MNELRITVEGIPKGQPRVRACIRGRHAGVYDPGTADEWKACVRGAATDAAMNRGPILDAVALHVVFRMPRPKAHLDKDGDVRRGFMFAPHAQKPDIENLIKAVMDALTNVGVWRDDAQVNRLTVDRVWCPRHARPGCDITLNW